MSSFLSILNAFGLASLLGTLSFEIIILSDLKLMWIVLDCLCQEYHSH